jgi:putative DNA methylase
MTDTPPYRTKLIEVSMPLRAINSASVIEKSIRQGHPSTLHLYWARRPLAACRAVIFASLVDDPAFDPLYQNKSQEEILARRAELHSLIEQLVPWSNTDNQQILNKAKAEIAASLASLSLEKGDLDSSVWPNIIERKAGADLVNQFLAENAPTLLDPFAGGGSIPLEGQRLGLRAIGSDLNQIPVLINKALIEYPPEFSNDSPVNPKSKSEDIDMSFWRNGQGLAEDIKYYGEWIKTKVEANFGCQYPKTHISESIISERPDLKKYRGKELTTVARLWSRAVVCPNPACNTWTPQVKTFLLSKKKNSNVYLNPIINRSNGTIQFEVKLNGDPRSGNVDRNSSSCLFCNHKWKKDELRKIATEFGLKNVLLATILEGDREKVFLGTAHSNVPECKRVESPEIDIPITNDRRWFSPPLYGMSLFSDLFNNQQLNSLYAFSNLVKEAYEQVLIDSDNNSSYAEAIALYLNCAISRCADYWSTLVTWAPSGFLAHTFSRQALPMTWDFVEANPFSNSTGNWLSACNWVAKVVERLPASTISFAKQHDATCDYDFIENPLIVTDPPYYDNIGYSDLSDYFYLWSKRSIGTIFPNIFNTILPPKQNELIASTARHGCAKDADSFFEQGLCDAINTMTLSANADYPICIFYAYKQTETNESGTTSTGWETFLNGLIESNLQITSTWPIRTERTVGIKGKINALSSSIVISCRKKNKTQLQIIKSDFIRELKLSLEKSLIDLQASSIAPVDLQQAAIGPGMAIFSKYSRVLEADGSKMSVRSALGLINQELDLALSEQEGEFDPETSFSVVWFAEHCFAQGDYGSAETLANAKAISVEGVVDADILKSASGKVRLLKIDELNDNWSPENDARLTVWEITHHLCRALNKGGNESAADLIRRVGPLANSARDLAYRLFSICDKNKWTTEAQLYNELVNSWADMQHLAAQEPTVTTKKENASLFE